MLQDRIEELIRKVLGRGVDTLRDNADLITDIGIDSLQMLQLISVLESTFVIHFDDDDLTLENFSTIASISNLVERKHGFLESKPTVVERKRDE